MSPFRDEQPKGLRERKKAQTRAAIQDHALRLYLEHGYEATTINHITDAAEVSESTFLRYFSTKAETVLHDRWDPYLIEALARQPSALSPLSAFRAAVHEMLEAFDPERSELERLRWKLIFSVPELRAAVATRTGETAQILVEVVAARVGRGATDFAVRAWVGALIGIVFAGLVSAFENPDSNFVEHIDAALDQFDAGLPL